MHKTFLDMFTLSINKKIEEIRSINIIGHTDLEIPDNHVSFDYDDECKKKLESDYSYKTNSNKCLGYIRALKVKQNLELFLKQNHPELSNEAIEKVVTVLYHENFLLFDCNKDMEGKLWGIVGCEENASKIKKIFSKS